MEEHVEEERRVLTFMDSNFFPESKGLLCIVSDLMVAEIFDEYSEPLFPKGLLS